MRTAAGETAPQRVLKLLQRGHVGRWGIFNMDISFSPPSIPMWEVQTVASVRSRQQALKVYVI